MLKLKLVIFSLVIMSGSMQVYSQIEIPNALIENTLNYKIDYKSLEKGNFQYFYSLLKQLKSEDKLLFENLTKEQSTTKTEEIINTFLPLDTKNLWDPKDENYLAVAKFNYILPINIRKIDEVKLSDTKYLQKTLPRYKITKHDHYFHVNGSFLTPDFNLYLNFLDAEHPYTHLLQDIDREKMKAGTMKASFMHQDSFGRVMMFRTAKMASAMIIYEDLGPDQTLVTQYILSNVINVPTKDLIRKGMIENLQNVVQGSRLGIKEL